MKTKILPLTVFILLVGAGLRLQGLVYGLDQLCLTPSAEAWLYDPEQVSSIYTWRDGPVELADRALSLPAGTRAFLPGPVDLLWGRTAGVWAGLITIALTISIGRKSRSALWPLLGAAVAVTPWFVVADRWVVRSDFGLLLVALNLWGLLHTQGQPAQHVIWRWLHPLSAGLLLLVAPPLWWLAAILIAVAPPVPWTKLVFLALGGVVVFPTLRDPLAWWQSAKSWDVGMIAVCVWAVLMLGAWYWRRPAPAVRWVLAVVAVLLGVYSATTAVRFPRPTVAEWTLVHYLQDHIPDRAVVYFDEKTWPLNTVIACPLDADILYDPRPVPVERPINPDPRTAPPPDYVVAVDQSALPADAFVQQVADHYWVGRTSFLTNASDLSFGEQLRLLDYEIVTPVIGPGDMIDIRLSVQYTPQVAVKVLGYSLFVHVTQPGQPGEKLVNFNRGLVEAFGDPTERRIVENYHLYVDTPRDAPPGTYDVLWGVFDVPAGQPVGTVMLGQVTVEDLFSEWWTEGAEAWVPVN